MLPLVVLFFRSNDDGAVWQEGSAKGQTSDARAKKRDSAKRSVRQESHQPETSHRDRSRTGTSRWRESPAQKAFSKEEVTASTIALSLDRRCSARRSA